MESDYFALLPDELVLKILKLLVKSLDYDKWSRKRKNFDNWTPSHDFLINTIAKLSTRFKRLTFDKTLWTDKICFLHKQDIPLILNTYNFSNVTDLQVHYKQCFKNSITRDRMTKIAKICNECPELVEFYHMNDGRLHSTWTNLNVYRNFDRYEFKDINDIKANYVIGDADVTNPIVTKSIYGQSTLSNGCMYFT